MGSSLQEQLVKAGLVTEQQVRQQKIRGIETVRRAKKKKQGARPIRQSEQPSNAADPAHLKGQDTHRAAQQTVTQPEPEDKSPSPSERKLLRVRVKALLRRYRVNDPEAETPYHFLVGKHIRRLYVTDGQHALLSQGLLAIIPFGERHYLIAADKLAALKQVDPNLTIITQKAVSPGESATDDPYAKYPVPDDLIW
ncbi:MAG: DUF2058 family protein [Gammaproteobacteria bacterium]